MSREIKFRAWSIKKRKYIDIDTLYCANGKVCGIVCNGIVYDVDDVILEQDTGIEDKNGKRICEGDICKLAYSTKGKTHKHGHKKYEDIEKVDFEYGFFLFSTPERDGISSGISFYDYGESSDKDGSYKYEAEVIGNIHENEELLK